MNHAITVGGLLLTMGGVAGLAITALGLLMLFAGGMSDDPAAGNSASSMGCFVIIGGFLLMVACIFGLL